jgi:serine phosphatase RsbU (regulator of sigma subunit)/anti-sigma regulatory factor (Ser/Thr protein kinase)/HPt (histidine-containing phosphotransfer) domain-containing protein
MEPRAVLAEALRGRRVLVVERDPAAHDSIAAQLAGLGLATDTAGSGPEALLRLARETEPGGLGLIVLAADLPGMGAAGLARALRGRPETRAVPLVTLPNAPVDPPALRRALDGAGDAAPAGLDLAAASARLGLAPGELADLLRAFAPQAEAHLAALARVVEAADAEGTRREAHALAGAAGNLGAAALHRAAKALEHIARGGVGGLAGPLEEVTREGHALLAAIAALGPAAPAATTAEAGPPEPAAPRGELADRRVLVVDDVRTNVDLLVRALKDDYRLSVAFDGESALRSAAARPPDLILLDIMMPGLDGYEVCRRLKGDPATRDVPVVFLTSLDEVRDKTEGFEAGAADYITKPFEILEVKARVRALLRAKAYQDAVRELLESELRVAREIQRGLVPRDFAALGMGGSVDCFACLEPARAVGGDLYDVFRLDGRRLCLVVGDVSGKGIPAALFMVMTITLIRSLARLSGRPDDILAKVNEALAADNPSSMFVTLFCAVLEQDTGRLTCASGGHLSPLLVRPGEAPRPALPSEGTLVGVLPGLAYRSTELILAPGDLLVAFTDGVTEARNQEGTLFGEARLRALLAGAREGTPSEAVEAILAGVREFAGAAEQADDIAILAVRYAGPTAPSGPPPPDLALELRATLEELGRAAAAVRAHCEARGVARDPTDDLLLGLDEVVANIVKHGYRGDPGGSITLRVRIGQDAVSLEIRDQAPAFNPLETAPPDLDVSLDDRPAGGLGLYLARSVVDGMEYERVGGENRLLLTRSLVRRAR